MRDAEDLDNFPPYPYAPSNNFLSDNGPNFSNLFGVKEQVTLVIVIHEALLMAAYIVVVN
jgi:hypothetical protein